LIGRKFNNSLHITDTAEKLITDAKSVGIITELEINTILKLIEQKRIDDKQVSKSFTA
jgi:hypothetical protein